MSARGLLRLDAFVALSLGGLLTLAWLAGCSHATAAASAASSAQVGAGTQAQAAGEAQAQSAAGVKVHRGGFHLRAQLVPAAVDGGAPGVALEFETDGDDISAGAVGEADAGAVGEADAGAVGEADAGAAAQVTPQSFWTAGRLVALVLGLLGAAAAAVLWLRKRVPL